MDVTLVRIDENNDKEDLETVTLSEDNHWEWTFDELPSNYDYEVRESEGEGYKASYSDVTEDNNNEYNTVTNYSVTITNKVEEYYDIDEEIVTDGDHLFDKDYYTKEESVNAYNAIEFEMSTTLPKVDPGDVADGDFVMLFHDELQSSLMLDENVADIKVAIGGKYIDSKYYEVSIETDETMSDGVMTAGLATYASSDSSSADLLDSVNDDCSFHVLVDLSALYNDEVISKDDLTGETQILVSFYADLEGTGLNGSFTSTVWYQLYDGEDLLHTSNTDVVDVYTLEILIHKYDADTDDILSDAEFGIYYDEDCSDPVIRYDEAYTVTSDEDGDAIFYGLAEGTYYVKEIEAPEGYALSDEVPEIVLDRDDLEEYVYETSFANSKEAVTDGDQPGGPEPPEETPDDTVTPDTNPTNEPVTDVGQSGSTISADTSSVDTGDNTPLAIWILVVCTAAAAFAAAVFRRKRAYIRK